MQPYLFPYLGYFQLINAVDKIVIYDNIEYTRKGWINRNRILLDGKDIFFTIPVKKDSDFLNIRERYLADNSEINIRKILAQISNSYRKAPFFKEIYPVLERLFLSGEKNLFDYVFNTISEICTLLEIKTELIISSELNMDHDLKAEQKVLEINRILNSDIYINPIGGTELYDKENFKNKGVELLFIKSKQIRYDQSGTEFTEGLSIIDVLMFNDLNKVKSFLNEFELV